MRAYAFLLPVCLSVVFWSAARGDELPADVVVPAASANVAETVRLLAMRLDADTFAARQQATQRLRELGEKAHPTLQEVAAAGGAEARGRALRILEEQLRSSDTQLQGSARNVLEALSKGNNVTARFAHRILHPPEKADPAQRFLRQIAGLRQARIAAPIAPAVRRYSITINENGRVIKIQGSEKKIEVEITQNDQNGQRVTKKYEAKDEKSLKENHPEAHQIFEQFSQRFGIREVKPAEPPAAGDGAEGKNPPANEGQAPPAAQAPMNS
jgi:hypothetical protein